MTRYDDTRAVRRVAALAARYRLALAEAADKCGECKQPTLDPWPLRNLIDAIDILPRQLLAELEREVRR